MSEAKKKLLGLFRSKSAAGKLSDESKDDSDRPRRRREHDHERPNTASARHHGEGERKHSHSPNTASPRHHGERERKHSHSPADITLTYPASIPRATPGPISQPRTKVWPPPSMRKDDELSQGKAMELIANGVPVFRGHKRPVPHASEEYQSFYATADGNDNRGDDRGDAYKTAFTADSFCLKGPGPAEWPWETLEQPSMEFCYGTKPGTITLNMWVAMSGNPHPLLELRDPGVMPREVGLDVILERLIYLETGFEEDYPDLMYKNLYKNLLRDPDKYLSPHKAMEKQIADLIVVLGRPEWADFSKPENQVVAKFFANATYTDSGRYKVFFHQLLLSTELDLRINSKVHMVAAKDRLLSQLPPSIAWDLALARKWRECMTIEKYKTGGDVEQIRFHLKAKAKQVKALRKFARAMKWPNLAKVDDVLKERDPEAPPLEDRSSDTMSYFTGMILPGVTMPWLVMNSLIDCDDDTGSNDLAALTHMHPNSGFQYKSTTYWSATSIVGKVLGPTCKQIAGWIGPARPAPDLGRVQIARIRQRKPKQRMTKNDVDSMTIRSDPLGPPSDSYPVAEYVIPHDERDKDLIDTIRIEKLALKSISSMDPEGKDKNKPVTYDAAVQFAIDGRSWPLRLSYDVSFISAYPCAHGPHVLFHDYIYKSVNVDEILMIQNWGNLSTGNGSLGPGSSMGDRSKSALGSEEENDEREKVLAIEAGGVRDNEVLARAWCSHWGLGAVVADSERTCMACAIREAYAACLNVVILIDKQDDDDQAYHT